MKLLLDMPVSPKLAVRLRAKGFDVVHLRERNLQTISDAEILELAIKDGRVVVSMDLDFTQLIATQALKWPSLILFRLHKSGPDEVGPLLEYILQTYDKELEQGAIISATDSQIRARSLPIR